MGYTGARQALAGGQYVDHKGLFYGGKEVQPSILNIAGFLKKHFSEAEHYVAIDVHTGLGSYSYDMLLIDRPENSWTKAQGNHIVPGLYEMKGGFPEGIRALFTSESQTIAGLDDTDEERASRVSSTK